MVGFGADLKFNTYNLFLNRFSLERAVERSINIINWNSLLEDNKNDEKGSFLKNHLVRLTKDLH